VSSVDDIRGFQQNQNNTLLEYHLDMELEEVEEDRYQHSQTLGEAMSDVGSRELFHWHDP